uniref:Uncharacterized protein n=1 Tax=Anopheles dirus TaxID=7168 RepID=A0A182NW60_9DIPT
MDTDDRHFAHTVQQQKGARACGSASTAEEVGHILDAPPARPIPAPSPSHQNKMLKTTNKQTNRQKLLPRSVYSSRKLPYSKSSYSHYTTITRSESSQLVLNQNYKIDKFFINKKKLQYAVPEINCNYQTV